MYFVFLCAFDMLINPVRLTRPTTYHISTIPLNMVFKF
nr:MAG TPA: hypothetical protein [Caudoviricetes sp.]